MTGAGPVSSREIGRVKSAATRVALLPVVDLAGYTANTAFWLARAAVNLEVAAARARLQAARQEVATCAISGEVGTFANVDPKVEAYVAERATPA